MQSLKSTSITVYNALNQERSEMYYNIKDRDALPNYPGPHLPTGEHGIVLLVQMLGNMKWTLCDMQQPGQ